MTSRSSHPESSTQTAGFSQLIRLVIPVFFSARMHAMAQLSLYLSLAGYLIFFIVALVMHKSRMPTSFLVESGLGNSGWSPGTAWLLSISNSMYAFGGIDGGWCSLRRPVAKLTPSQSHPYLRGDAPARKTHSSTHDLDYAYRSFYCILSFCRSHGISN